MFQRKKNFLSNTKPKTKPEKNKDLTTPNINAITTHTNTTTIANYAAKKSTRVGKLKGDNDTWMEGFAVVNNNPKAKKGSSMVPTIRTYFQSQTTGSKVWDEPPSGASNIMYASTETRNMAELQVKRLIEKSTKKKNKSDKNTTNNDKNKTTNINNDNNNNVGKKSKVDFALQQAIEASLNQSNNEEQTSTDHPPASITIKTKKKKKRSDEDIAYSMAKQASISEHRRTLKEQQEKEEEMLKQAIKLSLEEEKMSQEFQEIMQVQQANPNSAVASSSCWGRDNTTNSCILSDESDDFFASSAFPFEQNNIDHRKISANDYKSYGGKNGIDAWNGRFVIPASTTPNSISSICKDKYLIAELD